jgi:hypothetical protein
MRLEHFAIEMFSVFEISLTQLGRDEMKESIRPVSSSQVKRGI